MSGFLPPFIAKRQPGIHRGQFRRVVSRLRRWRPLGALGVGPKFGDLYDVLPDGSIRRKGPKYAERRARKDALKAISSNPGNLVTSGSLNAREGRGQWRKGKLSGDQFDPHAHREWYWQPRQQWTKAEVKARILKRRGIFTEQAAA